MANLVFSVFGLWCIALAAATECNWDFEDLEWAVEEATEDFEWIKEDIEHYCGSMDRPDANIFTGSYGLTDSLKTFSCFPGEGTCERALRKHTRSITSWSRKAAKSSSREFRRRGDCMAAWKEHDDLKTQIPDARRAVAEFCTTCAIPTCAESKGIGPGCCGGQCGHWCHKENQARVCLEVFADEYTASEEVPQTGASRFLNIPTMQVEHAQPNLFVVEDSTIWTARFRGDLRVQNAGSYTFTVDFGKNEGSLSIDGSPVTGTVTLDNGRHAVEMVFRGHQATESVSLKYNGPDTGDIKTLVPFNKWEKRDDECAPPCKKGEDVASGFKHLQGSWSNAGSDLECNNRCKTTDGCVAWVRKSGTEHSKGPCWLSGQHGTVPWIKRSDRNAGTPGCQ